MPVRTPPSPGNATAAPTGPADTTWQFGPYRLSIARRELSHDGEPVALGGRAFDVLAALVERAGDVVPRQDLTARVWPRSIVEESSLRVQVGLLRRALGPAANLVVTVPGQGYSFVGEVGEARDDRPAPARRPPARLTRTIGRDDQIDALCADVLAHPLVTVTGFGGVGKTTVALAAAEHLAARFPGGVHYVDLGEPGDLPTLADAVSSARRLVLLDNCERFVADVAATVRGWHAAGAPVTVLATSRMPLGVSHEHVVHLPPLALPPPGSTPPDVAGALAYGAIALFAERARASHDHFALTDRDMPAVVALCRRLDGIPLALEMAASAVDVLGVHGTLGQVDARFALLNRRRRTRLVRQQTLRASFDWSLALLAPRERDVLRAVVTFDTPFTAAEAAHRATGLAEADVRAALGVLMAHALVRDHGDGHHVLSDLTRAGLLAER